MASKGLTMDKRTEKLTGKMTAIGGHGPRSLKPRTRRLRANKSVRLKVRKDTKETSRGTE
jgi:hypothetical protein